MSGIKHGGQRPKSGKNLKTQSQKKFRNDTDEGQKAYATKLAARRSRKEKKRHKKK